MTTEKIFDEIIRKPHTKQQVLEAIDEAMEIEAKAFAEWVDNNSFVMMPDGEWHNDPDTSILTTDQLYQQYKKENELTSKNQ